ncbi:MAG: VWA domain-containing protein [Candidatus Omnitrophica bacterium]|nr:VWA domain-containing protein [Candidatus Omnitrophota bacterium]
MTFKDPWVLIALMLVFLVPFLNKKAPASALRFSSGALLGQPPATWRLRLRRNLIVLRMAAVALLVIALARPQLPVTHQRIYKEGIDIILAVDTSTSMEALDFTIGNKRYNRLYVVKKVVEDFIAERPNDRIGMIAFAALPYVACPLTLDHSWLLNNLERVKIGMVEDGTAVGSSIVAALNRLKESSAKTKIIILLTDGRNNSGKISPLTAAEAARALGVKIYTIGAGSIGEVPYPVQDAFGRRGLQYVSIDIDESSLAKIAQITQGRYFRATDTDSLKEIYRQINKMEKTPFKQPVYQRYEELYVSFALLALFLIVLEQVLANTAAVKIP